MRIAYVSAPYAAYLQHFYALKPDLIRAQYEEQYATLLSDGFNTVGGWDDAFKTLGHDARSILVNAEPLQRAWALQEGLVWPTVGWKEKILLQQLRAYSPDVVMLDEAAKISSATVKNIRREVRSVKVITAFSGSPSHDINTLRECDFVLSCASNLVHAFNKHGLRAFRLRHGFNSALSARLTGERGAVKSEIFFAGGVARAPGYHLQRERLLLELRSRVPLALYCPQATISPVGDMVQMGVKYGAYVIVKALRRCGFKNETILRAPYFGRAANWSGPPMRQINNALLPSMRPPLFGIRMLQEMRSSAVALNIHIDNVPDEAGNIRLFEATGAGSCLLTDYKPNLREFFEDDVEVVSYRSVEECVEKASWLLENPAKAAAIAQAGQARTLTSHTLVERAREFIAILGRI